MYKQRRLEGNEGKQEKTKEKIRKRNQYSM